MSGIIDGLLPAIDSILGVRDAVGAVKQPVFFVTRTWDGSQIGEGAPSDVEVQMLPSPGIKDYKQDIRIREGGNIKSGDIKLFDVSGNKFTESDLDSVTGQPNIERLYRVGAKLYQVISITKSYVTWDIMLRELTNQTRYV